MNANVTTIRLSKFESGSNYSHFINQKVNQTDSEYILLIDDVNNSVELKKLCLDLMLLATDKNPLAGMVYADYELNNNGEIEEIHLLKHHIGRVRDNQDYGKVYLFRKLYLEKIGGFDESYPMYGEDVDLSLRIRSYGKKILYVPNSIVWHEVSVSVGGELSAVKFVRKIQGMIKLFSIHANFIQKITIMISWIVSTPYLFFKFIYLVFKK